MDDGPHRAQHPLANYQFSSDELRVLRECNTESFFQRSLPLGLGFGLSAYFGVKNGYLKPNIKYGSVPKVVVGVILGYFMGKFSYQQKCAEKLMQLPNSKLAEVLRQRKQNDGIVRSFTPDPNLGGLVLNPFSSSGAQDSNESARSSPLNLDAESRPQLSGLDDIYRPSLDTPATYFETELPLVTNKATMTYDELRKKNRDEYRQKQEKAFSQPLPQEAPRSARAELSTDTIYAKEPEPTRSRPKTNKYGDTWTD